MDIQLFFRKRDLGFGSGLLPADSNKRQRYSDFNRMRFAAVIALRNPKDAASQRNNSHSRSTSEWSVNPAYWLDGAILGESVADRVNRAIE
jgi:hypothetical protein